MEEDFIIGGGLDEFIGGLELTFEGEWSTPSPTLPQSLREISPGHWEPVRPVEVGIVLQTIEEIYLASIRGDLPPEDYSERPDWAVDANARSSSLTLYSIRMGSPLHVILDLPASIYIPTFAALAYGLAHVFGAPYRAATVFERAREDYFEQRVATARRKDEWLDYKAERVTRQTQFRLKAVDVAIPMRGDEEKPIEPPSNS